MMVHMIKPKKYILMFSYVSLAILTITRTFLNLLMIRSYSLRNFRFSLAFRP